MVSNLFKDLNVIVSDLDPFLELGPPSYLSIVKTMNPHFRIDEGSLIGRLCSFLDASSKYCGTKLFVFINIRSYVDSASFEAFVRQIIYRKHYVIFIESQPYDRLECEKLMIIDKDLCELRLFDGGVS